MSATVSAMMTAVPQNTYDQLSVAQRCQLVDFPLRRHQPLPRLRVACALTALDPVL
jgi:hypothetical protein